MNRLAILPLLLFAPACASVRSMVDGGEADPNVAANQFELIKSLAGEWSGQGQHGDEKMPVEVRYRITAGGSAVEETLFPGSEHEMITMYHLDNGKLMLTHYCAVGNQPRMVAVPEPFVGTTGTIRFRFAGATNLSSPKAGHMHDAELTIESQDRIRTRWTFFEDGKPADDARFEMTRKSAGA